MPSKKAEKSRALAHFKLYFLQPADEPTRNDITKLIQQAKDNGAMIVEDPAHANLIIVPDHDADSPIKTDTNADIKPTMHIPQPQSRDTTGSDGKQGWTEHSLVQAYGRYRDSGLAQKIMSVRKSKKVLSLGWLKLFLETGSLPQMKRWEVFGQTCSVPILPQEGALTIKETIEVARRNGQTIGERSARTKIRKELRAKAKVKMEVKAEAKGNKGAGMQSKATKQLLVKMISADEAKVKVEAEVGLAGRNVSSSSGSNCASTTPTTSATSHFKPIPTGPRAMLPESTTSLRLAAADEPADISGLRLGEGPPCGHDRYIVNIPSTSLVPCDSGASNHIRKRDLMREVPHIILDPQLPRSTPVQERGDIIPPPSHPDLPPWTPGPNMRASGPAQTASLHRSRSPFRVQDSNRPSWPSTFNQESSDPKRSPTQDQRPRSPGSPECDRASKRHKRSDGESSRGGDVEAVGSIGGVETSTIEEPGRASRMTPESAIFVSRFTGIPLSFHALAGEMSSRIHKTITNRGGEIVPLNHATYIILAMSPGDKNTLSNDDSRMSSPDDVRLAHEQAHGCASRLAVDVGWIKACRNQGELVDPMEWKVDTGFVLAGMGVAKGEEGVDEDSEETTDTAAPMVMGERDMSLEGGVVEDPQEEIGQVGEEGQDDEMADIELVDIETVDIEVVELCAELELLLEEQEESVGKNEISGQGENLIDTAEVLASTGAPKVTSSPLPADHTCSAASSAQTDLVGILTVPVRSEERVEAAPVLRASNAGELKEQAEAGSSSEAEAHRMRELALRKELATRRLQQLRAQLLAQREAKAKVQANIAG